MGFVISAMIAAPNSSMPGPAMAVFFAMSFTFAFGFLFSLSVTSCTLSSEEFERLQCASSARKGFRNVCYAYGLLQSLVYLVYFCQYWFISRHYDPSGCGGFRFIFLAWILNSVMVYFDSLITPSGRDIAQYLIKFT